MNPLANPDNWELVYAECRDEHVWAYIGPETQPWLLFDEKSEAQNNAAC
jgi:hypothetical protein